MGDSNRNFENTADLKNEDPPPILSPEIYGVFHKFANMLNVKSFMRLAMASKEMYERCMNDKMIKINIKEEYIFVLVRKGDPQFLFHSSVVNSKTDKYLEKLRQLKCNVSLDKIVLYGDEIDVNTITQTRRFLVELGVKKIRSLKIDIYQLVGWPEAVSLIKDFHLKYVEFCCDLPEDVLLASLQWNLDFLFHDRSIAGELLLLVDSPIPQIRFLSLEASADVLTQILWKIQTGTLKKLSVATHNIPWDNFTNVPFDYADPLPEERPLLIRDSPIRWFLHWDGGVTKCEEQENLVEFSKCEKGDFPAILQSKEKVHKALAEKSRESIKCIGSHFSSFFDGYSVLDKNHKGPFPEERPLLCKTDEAGLYYYLLNEDGSIDGYCWDELGYSYYCENYNLENNFPDVDGHLPLQKFLLKNRIEKRVTNGSFLCQRVKEFRLLFDDFEQLPSDFKGQLPERRPLIFKSAVVSDKDEEEDDEDEHKEEDCVVLYEDGTLVQYNCVNFFYCVNIGPCSAWNLPSLMITMEKLKEIVLDAPWKNTFSYSIDHNMFRDAFKGIETLPFHAFDELPSDRPLIFKKTELRNGEIIDERWVVFKFGNVKKCEWKDGRATFSRANPREFPLILTKSFVTDFFMEEKVNIDFGFYIDRLVLNLCLEDCVIHPYDDKHSALLLGDRPLIFEKTEVKHICQGNPEDCECVEEILHLCFINDNEDVIHITWGAEEDRFLSFNKHPKPDDLPPILKTTETLEYLFEVLWDPHEFHIYWYGSFEDFEGYLKDHKVLDFNYEFPLPKTRPLFFKEYSPIFKKYGIFPVYFFLRKDGLLIKCEKTGSHVVLTVNPKSSLPPSIASSSASSSSSS